jgi:RHS repeat-associated protein
MPSVSSDSSLGYSAMLPAHWLPKADPTIPLIRDSEVKNGIKAPHIASSPKKEFFSHNSNTVNELKRYHIPKKTGGVTVYGYRHYSPKTGQFLGRDPIAEQGGLNLYGFVSNDGVNRWDVLGLADPGWPQWHHPIPWSNQTYQHHNHKLCLCAEVNLKSDQHMLLLNNHAGPHSGSYHNEVASRMDQAYDNMSSKTKANARKALDDVVDDIIKDINSGKLKLYENKSVTPADPSLRGKIRQIARSKKRGVGGVLGISIDVINIIPGSIFEANYIRMRMKEGLTFSQAVGSLWNYYGEQERTKSMEVFY